MKEVITTILTDESARSSADVEKLLMDEAEIAAAWAN
jgi:hypothetical protein